MTEELVGELYMEAWKSGCKGCTVYRDGSRAGVLISNGDKKEEKDDDCYELPAIVTSRPVELEADVIKFQNNKEKWIAFIGLHNGRPYEIFTGINDEDDGIMLPKTVTSGKIIKAYDSDGRKHYDFQFQNRRGYKVTIEGLDGKFNPEYWNYAKLIFRCVALRDAYRPGDQAGIGAGTHDSETINTWKNGVERALKNTFPTKPKPKTEVSRHAARRRWSIRKDASNVVTAVHPSASDI